MLKNKFKIIALLTVIILTMALPIVHATDGNSDETPIINTDNVLDEPLSDDASENDTMLINENNNGNFIEVLEEDDDFEENEDVKQTKNDVYLTGTNLEIDEIIDGNLFVMADTVTIKSDIGGDAFICAKNIIIEDNGYIYNNLFAISDNLTINGVAYNLYAISQQITINGYIYRDIRTSCNTLNIYGKISRNVFVNCSNINFSYITSSESEEDAELIAQGSIDGDLNYTSSNEADIPEGCVTGNVNYTPETTSKTNSIQNYIINLGTLIITTIIIWLLCLWLVPKFLSNTSNLITSKKVLPVLGFGILTPIVSIIASILLIILGITSTLGILVLVTLFTLIAISTSIFIIAINNIACNKLKVQKNIGKLGILIASTAVIWLISLIPFVGSVVSFITIIIGLGIVIYSLPFKKEKTSKL